MSEEENTTEDGVVEVEEVLLLDPKYDADVEPELVEVAVDSNAEHGENPELIDEGDER